MLLESLQTAAIQVTPVIVLIWAASRFLSPNVQVWLWRLVFLRLTVGLLLWPTFNVPVLPPVPMEYGTADISYVPLPDPFPIWQVLWLTGVAILAIVALKETWHVRRLVIESHQETEERSHALPAGNYRVSDRAKVPMVIGLFKPTILIPRNLAETATAEELRMIVAHEQGHIAHGDLFWAWLIWAGRAAFFFHPLVWVAARCERFAREAAADRFAIERSGADPHGYGQVLMRITLADPLTSSLSPAGLTMSDSYRFIYRRLETMKTFSKRPTLGRLISTGALCAITFGLLPAFNFVPAAAQAPLDSSTEPIAYPVDDNDTQAVAQSPATARVETLVSTKKRESKDIKVKVRVAKPASQAPTVRIVDIPLIPADAAPAAPAAPPQIAIVAPGVPASAPVIDLVPLPPTKVRIQNVPARPATAPRSAKVRFRVALPARAPSPPQATVRFRVALPATPPQPTVRYRVALPASPSVMDPTDAAPISAPPAIPPVQLAAPARVSQPRLKRTTSTYQEGGVTKYRVTLSRPLTIAPAAEPSSPTALQIDSASTVQVAAPAHVVTSSVTNIQMQAAPLTTVTTSPITLSVLRQTPQKSPLLLTVTPKVVTPLHITNVRPVKTTTNRIASVPLRLFVTPTFVTTVSTKLKSKTTTTVKKKN